MAELGTGAGHLARARRAETARTLVERTDLPMAEVAFAAGFASVRQFNDVVRAVFATTPGELRRRARPHRGDADGPPAGWLDLRLAHRRPLAADHLLGFLARRAVPGVELAGDAALARALDLPHGSGVVRLVPGDGVVHARLRLEDLRDLGPAVARCRHLLDLDADPVTVDGHLGADPALADLVAARPGLRSPGTVDGGELAVRAVLGQQVSVAGARTLAGRLAERFGRALPHPVDGIERHFPTAEDLAAADPASLAAIGLPTGRARALHAVATAVATGDLVLDRGADRAEATRDLLALPGIGPWTAAYVAMRALGDPDVDLPGDAGLRRALERLGADPSAGAGWRPWRSYATHHLWAAPSG